MSRAALLSLCIVVALGGLGAFFALGERPAHQATEEVSAPLVPLGKIAPASGGVEEDSAREARTAVELVGPASAVAGAGEPGTETTTVILPLEVELSLSSRASVPRTGDMSPFRAGAVAGIQGVITGRAGKPAAGATVEFVAGPNVGRVLVADARGRYGATDLWQGLSTVLVSAEGAVSERRVRLGRLARTPLSVDFGATAYVGLTVKDSMGQPLEGAEVRVDGTVGYTDAEGLAAFPNVTVGKVLTNVRKEGFVRIERELSLARGAVVKPDQNDYTMRRGATLVVNVRHGGSTSVPAQLYLMPAGASGGADGGTTLAEFPWHSVSPIEVMPGRSVTINDLPEDTLYMRVFHPGSRAEPPTSHVRLHVSQPTQFELRLGAAPTVIGKVLREGKPVEGVKVTLEAPDRDFVTTASLDKKPMFALEMVLPHMPSAYQQTVTDGRGSFTLTAYQGIADGRYLVAESADGRWRAAQVLNASGTEVVLHLAEVPAKGGALEIEFPGQFQGLPIELRVDGRPRDPFVLRPGVPLVIEDLEHGTWRVHALWEGQDVIRRQALEIGAETTKLTGTLPEGALKGQTEDERRRAQGQ
jgi:hypothetical protein